MPCGDQSCGFNHVIHCLFKRCETSRNSCLGTAVVLTQKYVFLPPFRFLFVTNKYLLSLGVQYYLQLLATVDLECKDGKTSESTSQSVLFFLYHPSCFASRKQSYVTCVTYLCSLILHESYHYSKPNHSVIWNLTLVHLLGTNTALSHFTFTDLNVLICLNVWLMDWCVCPIMNTLGLHITGLNERQLELCCSATPDIV